MENKIIFIIIGAIVILFFMNSQKTMETTVGEGNLEISMTDYPIDNLKNVYVTIESISAHMTDTEGFTTISDSVTTIDLLQLQGVETLLGDAKLPAGKYTQIRLRVTNAEIVLKDSTNIALEIPSKDVKIIGNFEVKDGETTNLLLDFNAETSISLDGNQMKPVITYKRIVENKAKCSPSEITRYKTQSTAANTGEITRYSLPTVIIISPSPTGFRCGTQ